jgi:hypothetical protein
MVAAGVEPSIGTFQPNSQRNTSTVSQYHPLRALAALDFTDCRAPFLAGVKLPSKKALCHFSRPYPSKTPNNVRQHVDGEGYSSGKNALRPGLQNSQNAFKPRSVGGPRTAPVVFPASRIGKQRRDQLPLPIRQ